MSPKAKKILIGGALALALLGWRGYDAVKTVKLKEFVEHYNVFINNENRFLTHLNERTDFGSVPEAVMMPVRHSAGFMANSDRGGCHSIPMPCWPNAPAPLANTTACCRKWKSRGWTRHG